MFQWINPALSVNGAGILIIICEINITPAITGTNSPTAPLRFFPQAIRATCVGLTVPMTMQKDAKNHKNPFKICASG